MEPHRIVVLISGGGTNLQALIDAVQARHIPGQIVGVVSDKVGAYGLERARSAEIPTVTFPARPFKGRGRAAYDTALAELVSGFQPDLIVLAGWMRLLTDRFLDRFPNRIINLHPALPGQFPGTHAIERAYDAFQAGSIDKSGCMVHIVIPEVDAGPVIETAEVEFVKGESLESYATRLHAAEHQIIVSATAEMLRRIDLDHA